MTKLNDTQLILLSTAAQRVDALAIHPASLHERSKVAAPTVRFQELSHERETLLID